jgi:hypothetical protein
MKMKSSNALRSVNSGTIRLVANPTYPNLAPPNLSIPDDVQKYDIGTFYDFNHKTYAYAYAGGTVGPNMGAKVKNPQDIAQVALYQAADQYANQVLVHPVVTDGPTYNGIFPLDYLKGGCCYIFDDTGASYGFNAGIIASTARPADSGQLTITLDREVPFALTTSDLLEAMASPWANVVPNTSTHETDNLTPVCGVPAVRATSGQWLWIQTWGFCWAPSPKSDVGAAASEHAVYFLGDGSTGGGEQTAGIAHIIGEIGQEAGWVMSFAHGGGQGAPFIYLQIAR